MDNSPEHLTLVSTVRIFGITNISRGVIHPHLDTQAFLLRLIVRDHGLVRNSGDIRRIHCNRDASLCILRVFESRLHQIPSGYSVAYIHVVVVNFSFNGISNNTKSLFKASKEPRFRINNTPCMHRVFVAKYMLSCRRKTSSIGCPTTNTPNDARDKPEPG